MSSPTSSANVEEYIDTTKPVLVTGATGYLAGVLTKQLLEYGLTIHATVRDTSKKQKFQYLQDLADTSTNGGSIKFFQANLLEKGSFKDAMKGCGVVFHTASPFALGAKEDVYKELIQPAVFGTENVLLEANTTPSVKRIVLTSSTVSIYADSADATNSNHPLSEDDWNRSSTYTHQPYPLSKTLAEQKAWVIAGSQTQWKLVVMNPGFILGPGLKYYPSSESNSFIKLLGSNDPTMAMGTPNFAFNMVDVRDVAKAHIKGGFLPNVSGRYILTNRSNGYSSPEIGMLLGEKYTKLGYPIVTKEAPLPKFVFWLLGPYLGEGITRTWVTKNIGHTPYLNNTKAINELGMVYYDMKDTVQDMYQVLIDEGIVEATNSNAKKLK